MAGNDTVRPPGRPGGGAGAVRGAGQPRTQDCSRQDQTISGSLQYQQLETLPSVQVEGSGGALCSPSSKLDTMLTTGAGDTLAFSGSQYWKLTQTAVAAGYPRPTQRDWPGISGNYASLNLRALHPYCVHSGLEGGVDASFTWTNGGAS